MTLAEMTMPNAAELIRDWLLAHTEVTDLVAERIMARTGHPLPSLPFVRLDLAGGRPVVAERFEQARVQVHIVGGPETEAATVEAAQTIRAVLVSARAAVLSSGVLGRVDVTGPSLIYADTHTPPLVDVTFVATALIRPH